MADFMPRDILPDLWEEILKRHWTYLETEESIQKLEERKKLEGCLKKLLCMVRHDRKFFLPETALVLKNSIRKHTEFNAQKAIGAFESISQYANNLFTKPWRKEFRILKMYSGFFQHEIQSCLIGAEQLFEAMGYRRLSDDTLILDGPICPDQVTNVSRDAMAVYVELQIMKNIYMTLDANDMVCSWLDIFKYREKHVGGISQAVKDLQYATEEIRYRSRDMALVGDSYGYIDVQSSPNYATLSAAQQCQCNVPYHQIPQPPRQRMTNGPCCVHELPRNQPPNAIFGNVNYPTHNYHHQPGIGTESASHLPHMSHSRSLEHYREPPNVHQHTMLPHRHSFDHQQQGCTSAVHHQQQHHLPQQRLHNSLQQQQALYRNPSQNFYESPYDCIDDNSLGGSSISYAAAASGIGGSEMSGISGVNYNVNPSTYSNSYNVSGNRFPLPYNISNQLSSSYENNSSHLNLESTYAPAMDNNHMYAQVSKIPQNCMMNSSTAVTGGGFPGLPSHTKPLPAVPQPNPSILSANEAVQRQQQAYLSDQLIDFDDDSAAQFDPYHQQYPYDVVLKGKRNNCMSEVDMNIPGNYKQTREQQNFSSNAPNSREDMNVYAKPIPKDSRQTNKTLQNLMDTPYNRKSSFTSAERGGGDTTDMSYESANDDFSNVPRQHQRSPTQFTKNQDGVGSFELWNYVFKNLEHSGYNKDLGEREDFLVKSLDLDSLNITNESATPSHSSSGDKRRPVYGEDDNNQQTTQHQQLQTKQKPRVFEAPGAKLCVSTSPPSASSNNTNIRQNPQIDNNKQKKKSALKQTGSVPTTNNKQFTNSNKKISNLPKSNDNKSKANNNDNNNTLVSGSSKQNRKPSASTQSSVKKSSEGTAAPSAATTITPPSTQIIVTGNNEWSCRICTFINPDTTRICEICCRTKDNNLNATPSSNTATPTVSRTTPTCV